MLPSTARSARHAPRRPHDQEYPEVWDLLVDDCATARSYHVDRMFNFGGTASPSTKPLPERRATSGWRLRTSTSEPGEDLLAFEFWTGTFFQKGSSTGSSAQARSAPRGLVVFREDTGVPRFMSSNRHVTQGWVDVVSIQVDGDLSRLSVTAKGIPGHEHSFDSTCPRLRARLGTRER